MGAKYGAVHYGATTYGVGAVVPGSPIDVWRHLYGGWQPAVPTETPWRQRVATVTHVASGHAISVLGPATALTLDGSDPSHVTATLALEVADVLGHYAYGGDRAAELTPGAVVRLAWTVQTAAVGATTRTVGDFTVQEGLGTGRDRWGREVWHTSAVGSLGRTLTTTVFLSSLPDLFWSGLTTDERIQAGFSPLRAAILFAAYVRAADPTIPTVETADSWASVVAALATWISGAAVTVAAGTPSGGPTPAPLDGWLDVLGVQATTLTWEALFAYFGANVGVRVLPALDGTLSLASTALVGTTGYVISLDADVGGAFPVPWERLQRGIGTAANTSVALWYSILDDQHPPQKHYERVALALSNHRDNLDDGPGAKRENIVTDIDVVTAVGGNWGQSEAAFVADRLHGYLAAADTLTVQVDSACPPPGFGEAVRVALPADGLSGLYDFVGGEFPCTTAPGQWRLRWRQFL